MKKLMVAIAAAAISLAGVAGTWFEAGFGESATSTGGAWLTDGDVTAPTFEGETLVLEDAEAPVVFAAAEAKTPADGDIEVSTVLSFQGFQELPEIDPDAKAGVCALEGGNFWVVGYDAVGATNQWFDTGIAAVIGESVNVGVTVTNAVAGYQIGDSTLFEVPTRAEEIREVCYLGNGLVTALGADYTDKFVQIVLPEIEGLVATSDVTRAEVGATVEVWFVDGEKISSDPETKFTYTVGDDGVLTLDPAGQELPTATDAAAKIGTVLYLTLQDAINASQADDTVTLLADVSEKITIAADKQLTLDLNEKTLTGTDANYVINNLGTLVITGNGVVDSTAVSHNTLVRNGATGVMTIENGTFKSARITVKNDEDGKGVCGVLTINGGTFLASSEQGTEVWDSVQNWGVATINGGEFDGYIECRAESNWNAGVMTITGGTFQKPVQTVVVFDSTHNAADNAADVALTIEGGTFNDMVMRVADVKAKAGEAANVRVDFDESMPEYVASCETLGTVTIPGKVDDELNPAVFANDESVYCEAGYETKDLGDGKYGVEEIVYVAQVGTDKFETLAAAVTAATTGQTITVLDNLAQTESIEVEGKDITFDLNGKTLTFNVSGDGFYFFNDADCSVTNGTIVMNVPATANWYSAIYFEDAGGLVKDVTINSGNCKYGVVTGVDDYESLEGTADKTVVCENVDVTGSGLLFYAEAEKMTLDAGCSATQIGTNPAGATYSDALAAGWLGQLTVNGGAYTAEANVVGTMSSPATITLNAGTYTGNFNYVPVSEGYKEMGDHILTKAEAVELDAPEGFMWSAAVEGMQTLVKPMFMIGETGYASWDEAYAAAKSGDTLIVSSDAEIGAGYAGTKKTTIDLNGHKLSFVSGWLAEQVTVIDSSEGDGQVVVVQNGKNVNKATLDFTALSASQLVRNGGSFYANGTPTIVKFPADMPFADCTAFFGGKAVGEQMVAEGKTYTWNGSKWVVEVILTIAEPENGTLETSVTNAVPAGTTVTVTATPAEGYQLVSITTNGEAIAGAEFVMPEEDVTVAATFEAVPQSVKITLPVGTPAGYVVSNVTDGVAIDGDTSLPGGAEYELPLGATIEIWAVPADGFRVTGENPYVIEEVTSETAVELEDLPSVEEIPYVAQLGEDKFELLEDAIDFAQPGDTVTLLADITLDSELTLGKNLVLDFGGFTVTAAANADADAVWVKSGATVTLANGTLVDNNENCAIYNSGDLTIAEDFEIVANAGSGILSIAGKGSETRAKLTVNGKITALANKGGDPNGTKNGICGHGNDTTVGTDIIIGEGAEIEASGNGVYFPCAGTLTVNGGAVKGWENGIYAKSGTVTVTGGEISSLAESAVEPTTDNDGTQGLGYAMIVETGADQGGYADNLSFSVTGGKFTSVGAAVYNFVREGADPIAPGITGGLFKPQPDAALIAVGAEERGEFVEDEDGYYVPFIEEIPYAAQIGDQKYETLQEALNVGGEVVMLADCTEMVVVPAGVEVTLDFNGYKIDVNGWAIKNRGTLTIDDGVVNAREAAITMYGDSVTTINGGTFTSADNAVIMGQGSEVNGNVKLTINGGEFNGGIVTSGYVACGVYAANSGVYAINGGTFNIVNGCGICARAGQVTVGDEAVINVSGEIEGKVGDKATPIPCVALYVDRTEPPYPGYVAETDYLKATSNTLKIDELNQFWAAEADGTYSLHDDSEAVATVNDGYYLTVEGAFAALQAAEAEGVEIIESLCLAEDGIEFQFEGQSVSLAYMELLTVRDNMWLFKHFPFAGHVTLLPGKTIVAKGLADGATIDVPTGYVLNAAEPDPMGYIAYTAVIPTPEWDIVGGEGGINALVKEDGVTKYVEFTSITLTETGATVGLKAAKIDANGAEFSLICKTALTDTETFTLPATLNYEKGELGDATEGLFTVTADLSGYKQLFVVGVGPKTPAN